MSVISGDKLLADLAKSAYDHHKNHARFQELQRRWITAGYIAVTGALLFLLNREALWNSLINNTQPPLREFALCVVAFHMFLTFICGFICVKNSAEFHRHFNHADAIISYVALHVDREAAAAKQNGAGDHVTLSCIASILRSLPLKTSQDQNDKGGLVGWMELLSVRWLIVYFFCAMLIGDLLVLRYFIGTELNFFVSFMFAVELAVLYYCLLRSVYDRFIGQMPKFDDIEEVGSGIPVFSSELSRA